MNLDTVYGLIPRARFFSGGWGDLRALDFDLPAELSVEPSAVSPPWGPEQRLRDLRVREASFPSPEPDLPGAARRVHVRWLLPPEGEPERVALVFAAWGEEGYAFRTRLLAPLVRNGLSAVLLELPFYGARRPGGQRGPLIRTVADFVRLGRGAAAEARGLLAWLHREGLDTGVIGFSMGGQLACMVGAAMPFALDIVAIAASSTPAPVFTEGPISRGVAWSALSRDGKGPARPRLARLMRRVSVLSLPPPVDPRRAHLVGTRHDRIVPPAETGRIAAHWPGATQRWIEAGHVSAVTLHARAVRRAIAEGFRITLPSRGRGTASAPLPQRRLARRLQSLLA